MSYFTHSFEAPISRLEIGKGRTVSYRVLFLPAELKESLPFHTYPRLRIEGEIADVPVRGAWIPVGDGRHYLIVSPTIRKQTGLDIGDVVEVRFRVDDQDFVDVPIGLELAVNADDAVRAAWLELTPGKQRMFAVHVKTAKTEATEAKRVAEAVEAIRLGLTIRGLKDRQKAASK